MKKYLMLSGIVGGIGLTIFIISGIIALSDTPRVEAQSYRTYPTFNRASSTAFTLTTTSVRLLASSTPNNRRVGATIQPINCTAGGEGAFLKLDNDVVATANTGMLAFASSTNLMGDYLNQIPVVQGAVQGITKVGTCTVLVTEWLAHP